MKILVLTSRFPYPLEKGDKLRIYHQILQLSRHHEIILCAISDTTVQNTDYQALVPYCKAIHIFQLTQLDIFLNILSGILRGLPFSVSYFFNRKIQKQILKIAQKEQPQHIYCQLVRTGEYFKKAKYRKTLDYMDAFSIGMQRRSRDENVLLRPFYWLESKLLKRYETRIFPYYDNLTIISHQDKILMSDVSESTISIVPNGIDYQYFTQKNMPNTPPQYDIVFVGNLGYYPNIQAVKFLIKQVLPLLCIEKKDIKILIAGARPTAEIRQLSDSENVNLLADILDIRDAYKMAKIFVAPIFHGSGQQNKILEAMSMELPCITTTLVNNAILAKSDTEILVADTEGVFANKILKILEDIDYQLFIKNNARDFIEKTILGTMQQSHF